MINNSQLDIRQNPVDHFTFSRIDQKDFPWENPGIPGLWPSNQPEDSMELDKIEGIRQIEQQHEDHEFQSREIHDGSSE